MQGNDQEYDACSMISAFGCIDKEACYPDTQSKHVDHRDKEEQLEFRKTHLNSFREFFMQVCSKSIEPAEKDSDKQHHDNWKCGKDHTGVFRCKY